MVLHEQLQPIAEVVNMSRFCISVVNKKAKFNSNDDDDDDDDAVSYTHLTLPTMAVV